MPTAGNIEAFLALALGDVVGERDSVGKVCPGIVAERLGRSLLNFLRGSPGFGYSRADDGSLVRFPQIGVVVIDDDVGFGANACVDSGGLSATRLGADTRLDDLVYIAHNVDIGCNCLIMAGVRIRRRSNW